jgi:putative tricarboxylic transport membrane protein
MAWISAGLLLNAALISRLGFVLSCALLFALAARGFRRSMGQPAGLRLLGRDALIGLALSAPVYWLFTKGLGLTLPGLTKTGWL